MRRYSLGKGNTRLAPTFCTRTERSAGCPFHYPKGRVARLAPTLCTRTERSAVAHSNQPWDGQAGMPPTWPNHGKGPESMSKSNPSPVDEPPGGGEPVLVFSDQVARIGAILLKELRSLWG